MATTQPSTPEAVQACHECIVWLIPLLDQFPRARRFTLGDRIETALLEVLDALLTATYSRDKAASLARANQRLAVIRHLWRICFELKVIAMNRYEHGSRLFVDLGRQIGGWQKAATGR